MFKKTAAFVMAAAMALSCSLALARTVEPEDPKLERVAGKTVNATVGEYDEFSKAFKVIVYENDRFDDDDVERLAAGDILLVGGEPIDPKRLYNVATIDFLLDGGDNLRIGALSEDVKLTHVLLKEVMLDYVEGMEAQGKIIDAASDGRVIMED